MNLALEHSLQSMRIAIARRDRPFSHEAGTKCLIPRTTWSLQAFPTKICLFDESRCVSEIALPLHGPVLDFTVELNLESGVVFIHGKAKEGLYRLRVFASLSQIHVQVARFPEALMSDLSIPYTGRFHQPSFRERLSLGCHRMPDWPRVWQRMDVREILPALFHLAMWTCPEDNFETNCETKLLEKGWESFLKVAFSHLLYPRLFDDQYQGLDLFENSLITSHDLIQIARKEIRKIFIEQNGTTIRLLPFSHFVFGRMTGVLLDGIGTVDFEWSKGIMRRLELTASCDGEIYLSLPKPTTSFRLRSSDDIKGERQTSGSRIFIKATQKYQFDRFQK